MRYDLVAEGGGVKIAGLVGAMYSIESKGFEPSHLAGTSAGAIITSLRAAGYTPDELKIIMSQVNFKDFLDNGGILSSKIWNITVHKGLYKGNKFFQFMEELLADKGVRTFKDLLSDDPADHDDNKYRWKFKCYAADISLERLITLPDDASLYGIKPDDLSVALAVRMSMSIPFFFRPVVLDRSRIVDGGVISNFPIWTFDSHDESPAWPTFGLLLEEKGGSFKEEPTDVGFMPHNMFLAMFRTMMKANDRRFIRPDDFEQRTIKIPTLGVGTIDFDLSTEKKEALFHSGRKAAEEFLASWSFEEYVNWSKKVRGIK